MVGPMRPLLVLTALLILASPAVAHAQAVAVSTLAAPDAFTTPGRDTGLGQDLWQGASPDTLSAVLPKLAEKPLSRAAAALARRVLATGAPGPQGVGADPALLVARAKALAALGDAKAAAAVVARAPGLDRSAELSRLSAESALLAGDDARACAVSDALTVGREEAYWLRLRTYCQVVAGHPDQAQLTFELAQTQAKDPVFGRLMGAKLAAGGSPGAASLRNGLDYALSRSLGLDLAQAKPAPAVAAALAGADPAEPAWTPPAGDGDLPAAVRALVAGQPVPAEVVARLLDAAAKAGDATRPAAQAAALIVAAYAGVDGPDQRARLAALATPEGRAPVGRNLAMDDAGQEKLKGETALLALWTCLDAGPGGISAGQRARTVRALRAAGLDADARNFALEGLLGG
jgi:hypothetical protein